MKINFEKHVWEGWTVGDFIEHLELFAMPKFTTKEQVKNWCKDNQPYYKKHIPMVCAYFTKKAKL